MKAKREFLDYLRDIQEALEKLDEFTRGMNFEAFVRDDCERKSNREPLVAVQKGPTWFKK